MPEPFERAWARSVRRDAETVERVGDRIGPNRTDLANRTYQLATDLREWAREIESRIPAPRIDRFGFDMRDLDKAALRALDRPVNEELELTYLRAGADPDWERPHRNGVDITDQPELQTPYQRARRAAFEQRVADYRDRGLL